MHTTTTPQQGERINLLAAGLLTAAGAHLLLNLLGLPKLFSVALPGLVPILIAALKVLWTLAGMAASAYVIYNASFMINARSFAKSKAAARGAVALPLIGLTGMMTGFALLPIGVLALVLLRQPLWMAAFDDVEVVYDSAPNDAEASATTAPLVQA